MRKMKIDYIDMTNTKQKVKEWIIVWAMKKQYKYILIGSTSNEGLFLFVCFEQFWAYETYFSFFIYLTDLNVNDVYLKCVLE